MRTLRFFSVSPLGNVSHGAARRCLNFCGTFHTKYRRREIHYPESVDYLGEISLTHLARYLANEIKEARHAEIERQDTEEEISIACDSGVNAL